MHITLICTDDEIWSSGMRSISATLRSAGHQTTMVFAGATSARIDPSVLEGIADLARDSSIIGISSMTRGSQRAKEIAAGLRSLDKLLVWGGMHPTLNPEDCIPHVDLVCRGEGEGFMVELAERVASGVDLLDIANGACQSDGHVVLNELRPLLEPDALPFEDFSFENEYVLDVVDGATVLLPNGRMRNRHDILFSGSRGCLYGCSYCSNSKLKSIHRGMGRFARKMSVPAFVARAKQCRQLFPHAKYFYFTDEDFFARPVEEVQEFAETYPAEVGLPFECMASPRQITDEKMSLMTRAGLWRIDVGLESGSERVRREVFDRRISDETMTRAVHAIHKYPDVVAYYFLIIGNPYEERQDLVDAVAFLKGMPTPFFLRTYSLVFLPGTPLYDRACADGVIAGVEDSASEADFLAGLDYRTHGWKRKNLYLNSLLFLMAGRSSRFWMGLVPRGAVAPLTSPRALDFGDRHPRVGEAFVGIGMLYMKTRRAALRALSRTSASHKLAFGISSVRNALAGKRTERRVLGVRADAVAFFGIAALVVTVLLVLGAN